MENDYDPVASVREEALQQQRCRAAGVCTCGMPETGFSYAFWRSVLLVVIGWVCGALQVGIAWLMVKC